MERKEVRRPACFNCFFVVCFVELLLAEKGENLSFDCLAS